MLKSINRGTANDYLGTSIGVNIKESTMTPGSRLVVLEPSSTASTSRNRARSSPELPNPASKTKLENCLINRSTIGIDDLSRHEALLDEGTDAKVVTRWMAQAPRERANLQAQLGPFVLALLDELFRGGYHIRSPLYDVPSETPPHGLLELGTPWSEDHAALYHLFWDEHRSLFDLPASTKPHFAGSAAIGGTDAYLIIDDHLTGFLPLIVLRQCPSHRVLSR